VIQNVVTYTTIVEVNNPEMKLRPGMTATVSIVTGRAENALLVPNTALRFTPTLSSEEMKEIMMHMREEMMKRRGGEQPDMESGSERRSQVSGMRMAAGGKETDGSSRRKQVPRVWILDETGKLRPAFFKAGVTDDSYTEVVRGTLKEGQRVITGITSGDNKKGSDSEQMRRRARMMFPR
jgi:HlyD family secretion protein